jgi:hypothetical protein
MTEDAEPAASAADAPPPAGPPPVTAEAMLFSLVEPHPGQAVAYNDWYERDHQISGALVGAGYFSVRRWVAPRRLKALRFPREAAALDPIDSGSLLSVYWREGGDHEAVSRWSRDQWHWLNERGRIFTRRTNVLSTEYRRLSSLAAPGERVPLELALQHPFEGLVAFVVDTPNQDVKTAEALERAAASTLLPAAALLSTWTLLRAASAAGEKPVASGARPPAEGLLQLAFLRADPAERWDSVRRYAAAIEQGSLGEVRLAAGFIPTVPGTTRHLDEI